MENFIFGLIAPFLDPKKGLDDAPESRIRFVFYGELKHFHPDACELERFYLGTCELEHFVSDCRYIGKLVFGNLLYIPQNFELLPFHTHF